MDVTHEPRKLCKLVVLTTAFDSQLSSELADICMYPSFPSFTTQIVALSFTCLEISIINASSRNFRIGDLSRPRSPYDTPKLQSSSLEQTWNSTSMSTKLGPAQEEKGDYNMSRISPTLNPILYNSKIICILVLLVKYIGKIKIYFQVLLHLHSTKEQCFNGNIE